MSEIHLMLNYVIHVFNFEMKKRGDLGKFHKTFTRVGLLDRVRYFGFVAFIVMFRNYIKNNPCYMSC